MSSLPIDEHYVESEVLTVRWNQQTTWHYIPEDSTLHNHSVRTSNPNHIKKTEIWCTDLQIYSLTINEYILYKVCKKCCLTGLIKCISSPLSIFVWLWRQTQPLKYNRHNSTHNEQHSGNIFSISWPFLIIFIHTWNWGKQLRNVTGQSYTIETIKYSECHWNHRIYSLQSFIDLINDNKLLWNCMTKHSLSKHK
jgi:hypothetical protein